MWQPSGFKLRMQLPDAIHRPAGGGGAGFHAQLGVHPLQVFFDRRRAGAQDVVNIPVNLSLDHPIQLILGIDRFMSEARALTNLIGNGVATLVVAKWTNELDMERLHAGLNNETWEEAQEPEMVLDKKTEHIAAGR